jgi:ribosome-binding protein aMBF1 (putative translation factor)
VSTETTGRVCQFCDRPAIGYFLDNKTPVCMSCIVTANRPMPLRSNSVGTRIRSKRIAQGKTLRDLAAGAGISFAYLSDVENGKKSMGLVRAHRVAKALGVSLDWLVGDG